MAALNIETYNLKNARDLGGTPLRDDRRIKGGLLIRSCALGQATSQEIAALDEAYRPRYIIDLRAADEAAKDPDPMRLLPGARYLNIPLAADDAVGVVRKGDLREALALVRRVSNDPAGMLASMYRDIVLSNRGRAALKQVFDVLLEADGSCVVWHCTAGKDRAGIVAALILSSLGASREDIYEDYELTGRFMGPYLEKQERQLRFAPKKVKRGLKIMNTADPRFLDAAFDAIESQYGSVENYIREALGLDDEKLEALIRIYTER